MVNLPSSSDSLSIEPDAGESWIISVSVEAVFNIHEITMMDMKSRCALW